MAAPEREREREGGLCVREDREEWTILFNAWTEWAKSENNFTGNNLKFQISCAFKRKYAISLFSV